MNNQKGLSLVELMIAITLGLILMTGVVQMFLSSRVTFSSQQGMSRVQETGRLAINFIAQDVRMAGFVGLNGHGIDTVSMPNILLNRVSPPLASTIFNKYQEGISVYTAPIGGTIDSLPNTDILAIRGNFSGVTSTLSVPATSTVLVVPLTLTEAGACSDGSNRLNGMCVDQNIVISDYSKYTVFSPSSLTSSPTSLSIGLNTWGGDYKDPSTFFTVGAQVGAVSTHVYFIKNNVAGRPSLFQNIDGVGEQELLEGVVDMDIKYSRRATPTVYNPATTIGSFWSDTINPIVSLKVDLLVQSADDNVLEAPQTYTFAGGAAVTAPDRRLYQVFTTTIALRSHTF